MGDPRDDRLVIRVAIAATDADAEQAAVIALALATARFDVVSTADPHDVTVVLLSVGAVADGSFLTGVLGLRGTTVPVALEVVDAAGLPPELASLNWIWWDVERPDAAAKALAAAVVTDPGTYAASRALEAKAWAWANAGRQDDELLGTTREVAFADAISTAEADRRDEDSPIPDFLAASLVNARRLRRRRLRNGAVSLVAAVLVIVAVVNLVSDVRTLRVRSRLSLIANADLPAAAADVSAVKVAAFMLSGASQGEDLTGSAASRALAGLLSVPWPVARFTAPDSSAVNGFGAYDDGHEAWLARGDGTLQQVTVEGAPAGTPIRTEGGPLYLVATSANGAVVLASGPTSATLVRAANVVGAYKIPTAADELAVSADGTQAAVALGARIDVLDLTGDSLTLLTSNEWEGVLDVGVAADGSLRALVRAGADIEVVDVAAGTRLWRSSAPEDPLLAGALGADGSVVVSAERRLWWSTAGAPLAATPLPVPDTVTALATDRGVVAVSADATGTRLYDMDLGIRLPDTCRSLGSVRSLLLLSASQTVVCDGTGLFETWHLDRPGPPVPAAAADANPVAISSDRLPEGVELAGEITASTSTGQSVALGTRGGEVIEFDLPAQGRGILTGRWVMTDGGPVTSLTRAGADELVVGTDSAQWTVRTCSGCGLDVQRQIDTVAERPKRCFTPDLTDYVPEELMETLHVTSCRDTV